MFFITIGSLWWDYGEAVDTEWNKTVRGVYIIDLKYKSLYFQNLFFSEA